MLRLYLLSMEQDPRPKGLENPAAIEGIVLIVASLLIPILFCAIFYWKEFRKQIPLKPMYELFALSEPYSTKEIASLFPFKVKVKKVFLTPNYAQISIAKLKAPFYWEAAGTMVRYVVITPYVMGHHIEKWFGSLLLYVGFVTDESVLKDEYPDAQKYRPAAVCWGKEIGFLAEKNSAEGMSFNFKFYRDIKKVMRNRDDEVVQGSAVIMRQLPNLDDTNRYYWLAKCDNPLQLREVAAPVNYLIVNNALIGDYLKRGFDEMTLNIWYVIDESAVDDLNIDLNKCNYATECIVKFDKSKQDLYQPQLN